MVKVPLKIHEIFYLVHLVTITCNDPKNHNLYNWKNLCFYWAKQWSKAETVENHVYPSKKYYVCKKPCYRLIFLHKNVSIFCLTFMQNVTAIVSISNLYTSSYFCHVDWLGQMTCEILALFCSNFIIFSLEIFGILYSKSLSFTPSFNLRWVGGDPFISVLSIFTEKVMDKQKTEDTSTQRVPTCTCIVPANKRTEAVYSYLGKRSFLHSTSIWTGSWIQNYSLSSLV